MLLASARLLGRLPARILYFLAAVTGALTYVLAGGLRHNVWDNLCHVMGPKTPKKTLRKVARQVFLNWARYYADLIRLPHLDLQRFFQRELVYHGLEENVLPAISDGKGVILASAHFGNPELAIQGLLMVGIKVVALTEPLQPPALSRLIDGLRASKGHTFLPVNLASIKAVLRTVKAGGVVALTCDRDVEGRSLYLLFCDAPASVPVGAVELAMRTGAPIIPVFVHRRDGQGYEAFVEPPLELVDSGDREADLKTNVRRLLERFEAHLRRDPGQWTVLEPVWEKKGGEGR